MPVALGLLLLASLGAGPGAAQTEPGEGLSAFEPPALRDVDDRLVDLLELPAGEELALGKWLTAIGGKESVVVRRRAPEEGKTLELECVRARDRCRVVTHGDGSAELYLTRAVACGSEEEAVEGGAEVGPDERPAGLLRRRVVRPDGCFEDLRVVAPAPAVERVPGSAG